MTTGIDLAPTSLSSIEGISIEGAVAGQVLVFDSNLNLVPGAGGGGADHLAVTVSNATNAAVTLAVSSNQVMSGAFAASNAGISHTNLISSNNNSDTNYLHLTQTQVSALHPAVTVTNASNSGVSLTLGSNQVLSGAAIDSNITHNSLAGVTGGTAGNRKHIAVFDTKANAKLASGTVESVVYVEETEGLYNYSSNCSYAADDDLVLVTGDGGNTRWEMIQKMSRTQGDTGWINTGAAVVSATSAINARLAISTVAAIAIKGVRTSVPIGNYNIEITGVAGPKFIHMTAAGILASRDTLWDFNTQVPVMIVYWSGTAIVAAPQTEMHGIRDTIWHLWAHEYLGLQYKSGLVFTGSVQTDNNTEPGADDTKTYLWSTAGVVQDEDIQSTPGTGQWAQTLGSGLTSSNAGIFPFFYYNGTFVTTSAAMADRSPFIYSGANGTPQWNSGGTLTDSVTGDYIVYHYFANPMTGGWSVFGRPHNAKYTSLAAARTARPSQLTWSNYAELKHIYTAIFRVNTNWDTTHRCKLVALDDYRLTAGTPVAATAPTAHSSLSSLELAGAEVTYGHIDDQAQTIAGAKTFSSHPLSTDADTPAANELIPVAKVGAVIAAATEKTTPVDADLVGISDSAASSILKKLTWANLKATLKTYFDTLYHPISPVYAHYTESAGLTLANTNIIRWDTKVEDTHNAVTTGSEWKFTAPSSGVYEIQCLLTFAATAITSGQVYGYRGVFVDGSGTNTKALAAEEVEANLTRGSRIYTTFSIRLSTGSYFQIQALASASRAQLNDAAFNWIHIRKISN